MAQRRRTPMPSGTTEPEAAALAAARQGRRDAQRRAVPVPAHRWRARPALGSVRAPGARERRSPVAGALWHHEEGHGTRAPWALRPGHGARAPWASRLHTHHQRDGRAARALDHHIPLPTLLTPHTTLPPRAPRAPHTCTHTTNATAVLLALCARCRS